MFFFLLTLVAGTSFWEDAFRAHPDPVPKNATRNYFVVHTEDDPHEMCASHGWNVEGAFPIEDHWLLSHPEGHEKRSEHAWNAGARQVYPVGQSRLQKRAPIPLLEVRKEFHIEDPLFDEQWYLHNQIEEHHDMNVLPVWRRNITGKGITVAIVDDGLDYDHPDFSESFSVEGSWDYNNHVQSPKPLLDIDTHGTRCAGEIAAGINNVCGVGIAPDSKVAGIRILSGYSSQEDEARSLIHRSDVNDIYSCSWGPPDDGKTIDGPPALVRRAELAGIETGRNGKGSIYVVASGNGDYNGDNCNYDGYTNSIYSITVSAVDRQNRHPYYSESCSANLVSTYSSNYFDKISTSDRLDPRNPDVAKCTNQHTGTSAAAPIAAAIFALVLEQRPDLTWRDSQYLVRDTAKRFDIQPNRGQAPQNSVLNDWQITADGHHYHNSYGYGSLDADEIVRRAETWELVKPQTWYFLPRNHAPFPITPTAVSQLEVTDHQWEEANMDHIEHVRIKVSWQHEVRGKLTFRSISPAGIVSELAAPRFKDFSDAEVNDWEFLSVIHWNETGAGVWTLHVEGPDMYHGVVKNWQLKLFGQAKDSSKVKRFSEVWDDYEPPARLVKSEGNPDTVPTSSDDQSEAATPVPTTSDEFVPPPPILFTSSEITTPQLAPIATETAAPPSSPPSSSPEAPPSTDDRPANEQPHSGWSSHSLGYYIFASIVGSIILSCIAVPVIYYGYLRKRLQGTYDPVTENGLELNDYEDEFEIDDNELSDGPTEYDENFDTTHDDPEAAGGPIERT